MVTRFGSRIRRGEVLCSWYGSTPPSLFNWRRSTKTFPVAKESRVSAGAVTWLRTTVFIKMLSAALSDRIYTCKATEKKQLCPPTACDTPTGIRGILFHSTNVNLNLCLQPEIRRFLLLIQMALTYLISPR